MELERSKDVVGARQGRSRNLQDVVRTQYKRSKVFMDVVYESVADHQDLTNVTCTLGHVLTTFALKKLRTPLGRDTVL